MLRAIFFEPASVFPARWCFSTRVFLCKISFVVSESMLLESLWKPGFQLKGSERGWIPTPLFSWKVSWKTPYSGFLLGIQLKKGYSEARFGRHFRGFQLKGGHSWDPFQVSCFTLRMAISSFFYAGIAFAFVALQPIMIKCQNKPLDIKISGSLPKLKLHPQCY